MKNLKSSKPNKTYYKTDYQKYLNSPYWQQVRKLVHKRDKFICRRCNEKTKGGHVHHIWYTHKYDEKNHLEDLVYLCPPCHDYIHLKCKKEPYWMEK